METGEFLLLPGKGVFLPRGGGLLGFGATRESARRRLSWFGPVSTPFVCGVGWCWHVRIADRTVTTWPGADDLLGVIIVSRSGHYAWGEHAGIPALYQGIDVFAVSMAGLDEAVAQPDDGSVSFYWPWQPRPAYVTDVTLVDVGRNPRR